VLLADDNEHREKGKRKNTDEKREKIPEKVMEDDIYTLKMYYDDTKKKSSAS
jgi:hypothetical protein